MNIARPAAFLPNDAAIAAAAFDPGSPGSAAPGAGSIGFTAELANDPLGIVAGYLPQSDQLVMRQASDIVRQVVDATVHRLTLAGREACDLFARPDAFCHLRELRLTHCDDDTLVALADVLRHGARPAFDLVLDREAGVEIGAVGLRAIAPLNLSGIVLRGLAVPPAAALALSESRVPVSVTLPFASIDRADAEWIGRIPSLTCLHAGNHALSAASIDLLASLPRLTTLSVAELSVEALRKLAGGPRLQALSVVNVAGDDKAPACAALADGMALTSLTIGPITRAQDMALLARSRTISELDLYVGAGATSGVPALAAMPALAHLTLRGSAGCIDIAAGDIAAVCGRALTSLNLSFLSMDAGACAHVGGAQAASLTWKHGEPITDQVAALLAANPRLSSLTLGVDMVHEATALLLARAPGLQRLNIGYSAVASGVSRRLVTDAWAAAGKTPADLAVVVYEDVEDQGGLYCWG